MKPALDELRDAAAPGKVRELVVELFLRARLDPLRSGAVLSRAQRELRSLRSRQRRWVLNGLYDLVRYESLLSHFLGSTDGDALWVGLLAKMGLDADEARTRSGIELDYSRCGTWNRSVAVALAGLPAVEGIALSAGVDRAVAEELARRFGDQAQAFVDASNERGPVVLRANRARLRRLELIQRLEDAGLECEPGVHAPDSVILKTRTNLQENEAFKKGLFEVQDEGSQLLAALVEPVGLVVDLCAGAGGKTLALAASGAERVVATDLRERALQQLHKRAARAGARVEVHMLGSRGGLPKAVRRLRADRVLVDAPCSGTGVLRRHPEHRWLVDGEQIERYARTQLELLDRGAGLVKPGGRLVYGTCSVLPTENRGVVGAFLARHPDYALLPARAALGAAYGDFLEVAPHTHGTDGFFGAVFERQ